MASNGLLSINESGLENAKGILDSANTNLANARNQLTGITMPEKFSNSARLGTIPSSIQSVEKQVSGIQSYIDQKIKDFRRAEENAKNLANDLGKSLARLSTKGPSIVGNLLQQGKSTDAVKSNKIPANMMNSPEYEYYMSTQGKTTKNKTSSLFPFSDASLEQKYAGTMARERAANTSSKINFLIGGAKGIARAFETTADAYAVGQANSISKNNPDWNYFTRGDSNKIDKYANPFKKETMARVSVNYTQNAYDSFYNTKLGKNLDQTARTIFKKDGAAVKVAESITNRGTLMALGANPVGVGYLGYLSGKGEATEKYWSQPEVQKQIQQGKNIDEIYNTGNKYGNVKGTIQGVSMAFQKSTGAGGKVDNVLNKAWKRVLADSAAGGAEVYANAYAESVRTGKSYSEAFKDIGGHEAVAKNAATSGAVSAIGELVRWGLGNNANKDQDITKVTEQQEKNIYEDAEAIYTNEGKNVNVGLYSDGVQMKEEGQVIYDELDFRKGKTPFSKEHLQEVEQTIYSPSDALFMKNAKITGDYGNDQDVTHDLFDVVDSKGNVRRFGARDGAKKGIKDIGELEVVPKEGYKATKKYLTESTYKMSNLDAEQTISMMNSNTGLCKNARLSNELVQLNVDNAELYENIMGNKSKEAIQMCDSFIYHNHIENGGKIFRENNGRTEIIPGAVDGYSNGLAQDKGITKAGWLDNKGLYVATNDYAKIITGDKNIEASVTNLGTSEVTEQVYTEKMIEAQKVLKDGKGSVSINIPASEKSSINLATKNDKGEYAFHQGVNAHDITVTGVTKEGIVATSWGKRVFASHQELFGNNCLLFITKKGK